MVKTFFEGAIGFVPQQQSDFNKLLLSANRLYCSLTNAFFSSFVFIYIILSDPYLSGDNGYGYGYFYLFSQFSFLLIATKNKENKFFASFQLS